jgi:NADPH2:quinone reductase
VPEESLAPLPQGWKAEEGAAGPLTTLTAWQALVTEGNVQPGQAVLVTGASGGVGTSAVELAKALGARVVALSRSESKQQKLKELGADFVFDTEDISN